jgi:hypothetical protein
MSEEIKEESTGKSFKGIIITLVSTVTLGVGGFITNKLTGGGDDKGTATQTAAPVINITNSNAQQAAAGKTVIINQSAPAQKDLNKAQNSEKPKPKKKEGDEFKEDAPKW